MRRAALWHFWVLFHIACFTATATQAQHCSDCKIPAAQRTARLAAADRRLDRAEEQRDALIAKHLPFGQHQSTSPVTNERLLIQIEWIALYDDDLRIPLWVAYELTKVDARAERTRQDCFRVDNRLPAAAASTCEDYDEQRFDRGHLIPRDDLNRTRSAHDNSFLFSNMVPQRPNFNQKVWRRLEAKVNGWAISADGILVVSGSVFDKDDSGERDADDEAARVSPLNRVAVPTHFYKIIIKRRPNGVIDTISFLLPHNNRSTTNKDSYLQSKIVSIDRIETLTGADFFPAMEPNRQQQIEQGKASKLTAWFTF